MAPCPAISTTCLAATPGAKRASMTGMFDIVGRFWIWRSVKLVPILVVVTSSRGASPVTVTVSSMVPISSVNGRETCWPPASVMPVRLKVLNPAIATLT